VLGHGDFLSRCWHLHPRRPEAFLPIMPDWVPAPRQVILFTGACEIVGAVARVTRSLRWWAGAMLALYAAGLFPANVKHAVYNVQVPDYRRVGGTMCLGWLFSPSSYGGRSILRRSSAGPSVAARNALPARAARTSVKRRNISDPLDGLAMFSPNKRDERFCASAGIALLRNGPRTRVAGTHLYPTARPASGRTR